MTVGFRCGSAQAALELILGACGVNGVADLDAVSYVLATAHHESAMGRHLTEIANGTNPVNPCDPDPESRTCQQH